MLVANSLFGLFFSPFFGRKIMLLNRPPGRRFSRLMPLLDAFRPLFRTYSSKKLSEKQARTSKIGSLCTHPFQMALQAGFGADIWGIFRLN